MREYAKKPENQSHTLDSNPRASKQAPISQILQAYRDRTFGKPEQRQGVDEDELLQAKAEQQDQVSIVSQRYTSEEDEELLQAKFDTTQREEIDKELMHGKFKSIPTTEQDPIQLGENPNNTGLPDNLKSGIENLSGYSMDDVKVHYNSDQPAQLQALAYTQGTDIHVAPGQEKYLPHEAWHVVQQKQGRVQPTMQMQGVNVNDNEGLEKEADMMGKNSFKKVEKKELSISQMKSDIIQKKSALDLQIATSGFWSKIPSDIQWLIIKYDERGYNQDDFARIKNPHEIKFGDFQCYLSSIIHIQDEILQARINVENFPRKTRFELLKEGSEYQKKQRGKSEALEASRKKKSEFPAHSKILRSLELSLLHKINTLIENILLDGELKAALGKIVISEKNIVEQQLVPIPEKLMDPYALMRTGSDWDTTDDRLKSLHGIAYFKKRTEIALDGLKKDAEDLADKDVYSQVDALKNSIMENTELAHYTHFSPSMYGIMSLEMLNASGLDLARTNPETKDSVKGGSYVKKSQGSDIGAIKNTGFAFFFVEKKGTERSSSFGKYRYSIPFNEMPDNSTAFFADLKEPYKGWNEEGEIDVQKDSLRTSLKKIMHFEKYGKDSIIKHKGSTVEIYPLDPLKNVLLGRDNIAKGMAYRAAIHLGILKKVGQGKIVAEILQQDDKRIEYVSSVLPMQIMIPYCAMPLSIFDSEK